MTDELTLFDASVYGEATPARQRHPKPPVKLVPRPPGYHLVGNRTGVIGFHRTTITAEMTAYNTVMTLCGVYGHRVGEYPPFIPLCAGCEEVWRAR